MDDINKPKETGQGKPLKWAAKELDDAIKGTPSLLPEWKEWVRGPLSVSGSAYRIIYTGSIGIKEIDNLIKILTLQKEILNDFTSR